MSETLYDRVRYPGKFYPQSAAARLATMARLHGVSAADPARCSVLELGCGDGGNLIPQAALFPGSRFLGIDLAASAIESARRTAAGLDLANIDFEVGDLATWTPPGHFDFIVSHGVLSWVPEAAREGLLRICADGLAPAGVAYVSYSALPGGHVRNVPRDLMRFHTRMLRDPAERVARAREAVEVVRAAMPAGFFGRELLDREMAGTEGKDFFLLHDLLAEENEPLYFVDLVDAAGQVGLQFLCEAEPSASSLSAFPPAVRRQLEGIANRIEREQYLDFIHLRRFRQTLLCRREQAPDLAVEPGRLAGIRVSSAARPVPGDGEGGAIEFRHPWAGGFRAEDALTRAIGLALAEADPRGIVFEDLLADVDGRLAAQGTREPGIARAVMAVLLSLFERDVVSLHAARWTFATAVGPRPAVTPLTRLLAGRGAPVVTGALGSFYLPGETMRRLVMLLDGTRGIERLLEDLAADLPPAAQAELDAEGLQRRLRMLADNGLLIDEEFTAARSG